MWLEKYFWECIQILRLPTASAGVRGPGVVEDWRRWWRWGSLGWRRIGGGGGGGGAWGGEKTEIPTASTCTDHLGLGPPMLLIQLQIIQYELLLPSAHKLGLSLRF